MVLEDAGADYVDVARLPEEEGGGAQAIVDILRSRPAQGPTPFAPPILRCEDVLLAQTSIICCFVAEREGLAPETPVGRLHAHQLMLTVDGHFQ